MRYYYPRFIDKEMEAERGQVICPRSHNYEVVKLGFEHKQYGSRPYTLTEVKTKY